jgi:L-asparagine oxygenase
MPNIEVTTITLDNEDAAVIADITEQFPAALSIGHEAQAVSWVEQKTNDAKAYFANGVIDLENAFRKGAPVIHMSRELQDGDLPPTPTTYQTPEQAEIYSFDIAQLVLTSLGGMAYGNRHVRDGRILTDVFPKVDFAEATDTAFGSGEIFDFHADGAVHRDTTPDIFSLHCVRNSEKAPTFFSSVSEQDFDGETFAALQEPVFTIYYVSSRSGAKLKDVPVIEIEASGKLRLNYYGKNKIDGPNDEVHKKALDDFEQALHTNVQEVTLQPGDVVLVDNQHVQHGRRAFQATESPDSRRWLRRVYAGKQSGLMSLIEASEDRILDSAYEK